MNHNEKLKLEDHLCFNLYVASRLIVQGYGTELKSLGLTYPKYLVLLALDELDGQTVSEIGEKLSLDSGTLSPLLKSLAKSGYIERRRLEDDERTVRNHITRLGRRHCLEAQKVAWALFEKTELSKAQFVELRAAMEDFVLRCKAINEARKKDFPSRLTKTLTKHRSPHANQ